MFSNASNVSSLMPTKTLERFGFHVKVSQETMKLCKDALKRKLICSRIMTEAFLNGTNFNLIDVNQLLSSLKNGVLMNLQVNGRSLFDELYKCSRKDLLLAIPIWNLHWVDMHGRDLLYLSALYGHLEILKRAVQVYPINRIYLNSTPLDVALATHQREEIIITLLQTPGIHISDMNAFFAFRYLSLPTLKTLFPIHLFNMDSLLSIAFERGEEFVKFLIFEVKVSHDIVSVIKRAQSEEFHPKTIEMLGGQPERPDTLKVPKA